MSAAEMTVAEFASKHCREHDEHSAEAVQAHVNVITLAALTMNRALWEVGVDADGRVSLIWISLPEHVFLREARSAPGSWRPQREIG